MGVVSAIGRQRTATAWYALKTRSRHEKVVARALTERGVACFLPTWRKRSRWSDRVKTVELPLFSTYVFVRLDGLDPAARRSVLSARGAVALVGSGGVPAPVADAEIGALQSLVAAGAPLEPHRFLRRGQRARVCSGPFRGVEGTLVKRDARSKLVISVELFRRAVALTIDAGDVEPA
jgi:transcription antitermination factor NusG